MSRDYAIDKKIKRKKIKLIFIIILLLIAIFIVLYSKTSFFNISSIEIRGNEKITDEKIILASGIIIDENIFKINMKAIEENLILHPYIKQAKARRRLPNKIVINIDEREEAAIIDYFGSYVYIDNEGIILNVLSEKDDDQKIQVRGLELDTIEIGKQISIREKNVEEGLLNLINLSQKYTSDYPFEIIDLVEEGKTTIYIKNGGKVEFGALEDVEYKLNFLLSILQELENKNQSYKTIHLDKGDNAIIIKDDE